MKKFLLQTDNNYSPLAIRFAAALVLFPHGAQKALGWFNGYGFEGTMNFFTQTVHIPYPIGLLVIIIEFFGPLFLLAGFATRFWAFLIIPLMIGIIFTSHIQNGFFMNWFGNQPGEGIEFDLLYITLAISLVITGSGRFSVDRWLWKFYQRRPINSELLQAA